MQRRNVAILLFEGVQIIDYTGPYEAFGTVGFGDRRGFNVYTVAESTQAITTAMGMSVNPKYDFDNCPAPQVLVVPGGAVTPHLDNARLIDWIRAQAQQAEAVLSVCNGAFLLGKAGLLDGLRATTTSGLTGSLQAANPNTRVVSDERFVDNGKIVTTAGLSSGIDGALHVIGKLLGGGWARQAALNMEYDWRPESNYTRALMADAHIPHAIYEFILPGDPERVEGNTDRWDEVWSIPAAVSAAELQQQIDARLAAGTEWSPQDAGASGNAQRSDWAFTDTRGRAWNATIHVQPAPALERNLVHIHLVAAQRMPA